MLNLTRAAGSVISAEPELGQVDTAGCAARVNDPTASGGSAVSFGGGQGCGGLAPTPPSPTPNASPSANAGASLPITYNLSSLPGTHRYVATNGSDTAGSGSAAAPYATLARAYSAAAANDSIVIRGGTYRQGNITISSNKPVSITAYPGETPVFNGAQSFAAGWVAEGSYKYHAYTAQPVTDGSGISFTSGQNLTGNGVGKYPDQAWSGSTQLRQVTSKAAVTAGTFWVDGAANRLYVSAATADQGNVEASQRDVFMSVQAARTTITGIRVTRFSNSASDYGVIKFSETADNSVMENVEISDSAFMAVLYGGGSDLHTGSIMRDVTLTTSNWMGASFNYTTGVTLEGVKITRMNQFDEFTHSPQSGAVKTSRTRGMKITSSVISDNRSHGLWFDQSNYDIAVLHNEITNNAGTGVFFEISDKLLLADNYIRSAGGSNAVKLAGSSGMRLINNTIIGGPDVLGIYVDNRSKPGCADPSRPLCANSYSSDRDTVRPYMATIDWMPRLDLMLNNIIAYPTATGYCGGLTAVCITQSNGDASVPIQTVLHKPDALRPQTAINGNVYANGNGTIISTAIGKYASTSAFSSAMAGSPVGISGFDTTGLYGNTYVNPDGTPALSLSSKHAQASPAPTDPLLNTFVPSGTRHYGATFK